MADPTTSMPKLHKPEWRWLEYLAHEIINLVDSRYYSRRAAASKIRQRFDAIIESAQRTEADYQQEQTKRRVRGEPEPKYWCAGMPGCGYPESDPYDRKRRESLERFKNPKPADCPVRCTLPQGHDGPCHINTAALGSEGE